MPFIPVPNTAQAELILLFGAQRCQNVLHFEYPTSPGSTELTNLGTDLGAWWTASIAPIVTDSVTLESVVVSDLTAQNAEAVEVAIASTGAIAETTSVPMPSGVTIAVKKVTGLRGRSFRGRIYHLGLVQSQVGGNGITSGFGSTLRSAYLPLLTYPWTDTGWTFVVVSRFADNAPRVTGVTTPITDISVDLNVDSQRRRLAGRGQ